MADPPIFLAEIGEVSPDNREIIGMTEMRNDEEIQEGKFFAVISYLSFLCIVSLLFKKDNKFALFHAKQGLVIFVFQVVCIFLSVIPLLGTAIKLLGMAIAFMVSIWGIWHSLLGKYFRIPLISDIADNIVL